MTTETDTAESLTLEKPTRPHRSTVTSGPSEDRLALDAVYEVAKSFASEADPLAVVPQILNILSSFLDLRHGVLALLSEPDGTHPEDKVNPYSIAATTFRHDGNEPTSRVIPDQVASIVFRSGVPLICYDLEREYGANALPDRLKHTGQSLIAVPIRDPDKSLLVMGVLCAYRSHDSAQAGRSNRDLRVLTMVASLLEQALRFRLRVTRDRERALADARRLLQAAENRNPASKPVVSLNGIVGDSPAISQVIEQVRRVGETNAAVLLRGESGTGKELFARAVHSNSSRKKASFVSVNCAALSESLLESELFGHEKGAFTGANAVRKGRFEMADGGTLFLDEIGEISPTFQTKLLRVLQEGEFERVGGTRTQKADFRLVSATNRDLEEAVAKGDFRADLYFRICVVPILLPPLRDRKSDIRPLAQLFLDRFNEQNETEIKFAPDAFDTICRCSFPGNVRELENCVNRAAALSDGSIVLGEELACSQGSCLSAELSRLQSGSSPIGGLAAGGVITPIVTTPRVRDPDPSVPVEANGASYIRRKTAHMSRDELVSAMEEAGWVQAKAARLLGMTPRQIAYALQKHEIPIRKI